MKPAMKKTKPKAEPRRIGEAERLEITLARFERLKRTGTMTPLSELARRFERDEAVVSRIISSALRAGAVEFRITPEDEAPPPRRPDLETQLLKRFPGLNAAVVVTVPDPPAANRSGYGDDVHRALGAAFACELARGSYIRNGDSIGIGPGRGVYETVRALQKQPSVRARDVTLVSLSGVGYMRHHGRDRNLILDPDFIVAFMGEAFEHTVGLDLVAAPLVPSPGDSTRVRNWLVPSERPREPLDLAILGVGVFSKGNRFYEEGSSPASPNHQPAYDPIRPALQSLRSLSAKFLTDAYAPLGDIGYHIFPVPSPDGGGDTAVRKELERQADSINKHLLSAHEEHFKAIRSVMLVAGTAPKAWAVQHLLRADWVRVTQLCTDKALAEVLLGSA